MPDRTILNGRRVVELGLGTNSLIPRFARDIAGDYREFGLEIFDVGAGKQNFYKLKHFFAPPVVLSSVLRAFRLCVRFLTLFGSICCCFLLACWLLGLSIRDFRDPGEATEIRAKCPQNSNNLTT